MARRARVWKVADRVTVLRNGAISAEPDGTMLGFACAQPNLLGCQDTPLGDPSMADEILAADFYSHAALDPSASIEGVKATATMVKSALPDAQANIEFQVAEGDKVVSHYTWSGTHQGEAFGVPATGKQVSWTITTTFRIADGKIREAWLNWDQWGLMQQLGVVSMPGG